MLSIHAPREGSDPPQICTARSSADFNPRSTYGERWSNINLLIHQVNFNPRPPHWERSTLCRALRSWVGYFNPRSPHRERWHSLLSFKVSENFNPRSTYGERFSAGVPWCKAPAISIHASLAGSDEGCRLRAERCATSIHAPHTGSDATDDEKAVLPFYFNPRSPHGERCGSRCGTGIGCDISIHAPLTGSDSRFTMASGCSPFNPRSP